MQKDRANETMARLLEGAGIRKGMHVLDVGCGHGGVSLMVADLVGPEGRVLGIDRAPAALDFARKRIEELGVSNVTFANADVASPPRDESFDAIVGRRVLMYVQNRDNAMRALVEVLRPGGIAAFQEIDTSMLPASSSPLPLHEKVHRWIWQTVQTEGATTSMGFELPGLLARAGLEVLDVRAEAIVQTPGLRHDTAAIVKAILPRILDAGVATLADIDPDTLDERLAAELTAASATFIGDLFFSVCARKPG